MLWSLVEVMLTKGLQFVVGVVLARMLLPDYFGMVSMAMVYVALSMVIVDAGFSQALIREPAPARDALSTLAILQCLIALVLGLLLFFLAEPAAILFGEPDLVPLVRAYSLQPLLHAPGLVPLALAAKKMQFRKLAFIAGIAAAVSGAAAVMVAMAGGGIWALVVQSLVFSAVQSMLALLQHPPHMFLFRWRAIGSLFRFGSGLMAAEILNTAFGNVLYVLIGRMYAPDRLGYYVNAERNRDVVMTNLSAAVQRVVFPHFSMLEASGEDLRAGTRLVNRWTVFAFFPVMMGMMAIGLPFYELFYGDKWQASVPMFQVLCLAGVLYPVHVINLSILKVKGRSDLYLKLEIIKKAVFLAIVVPASFLGMAGLLAASVMETLFSLIINSRYAGALIGYHLKDQLRDMAGPFAASGIMAAFLLVLGPHMPLASGARLAVMIPSGLFLYLLAAWFLSPKETRMLLHGMR